VGLESFLLPPPRHGSGGVKLVADRLRLVRTYAARDIRRARRYSASRFSVRNADFSLVRSAPSVYDGGTDEEVKPILRGRRAGDPGKR